MGEVIRFVRRAHARASSRAASSANASAVNPASRALSVRRIGNQYSWGILFLCDHFRAAAMPAPMSAASASGVSQRRTISRKLLTDMEANLGHSVLNCKAIPSRDITGCGGQTVPMAEDYKKAFHDRVRAARKGRNWTQEVMADLLGYSQGHYKQWETRDLMPHEVMPRFCTLTGITLDYLLSGRERPERALPVAPIEQVATQASKTRKSRQRAS